MNHIVTSILSSANNIKKMLYEVDYKSNCDVKLSIDERKALCDFFILYDVYGGSHERFGQMLYLLSRDDIRRVNMHIYYQMNNRIRAIYSKLGVDPCKSIICHDLDASFLIFDKRIYDALYASEEARVGGYTIKKSSYRPFDELSPELIFIRGNRLQVQELIQKHKNGLSKFCIFENDQFLALGHHFLNIFEGLDNIYAYLDNNSIAIDKIESLNSCDNNQLLAISSQLKSFENELLNHLYSDNTRPTVRERKPEK